MRILSNSAKFSAVLSLLPLPLALIVWGLWSP